MFQRTAGVLLHISSLPGDYGIGSFGKEARAFARHLKEADLSVWQVLPFGHTGEFNSPYQCYSAFAGNPFLIDLPTLYEDGLLSEAELKSAKCTERPYACDFPFLKKTRFSLYEKAYSRMDARQRADLERFREENDFWLSDYALFMVLCEEYGTDDWRSWDKKVTAREPEAIAALREKYAEKIAVWVFIQYEFFRQWNSLKAYVNDLGIGFVGDMPIYLPMNSVDVWSHPALFQLGDDFAPKKVSGVPPDYFSEEGQLWGNPLYDWEKMKSDGYAWWLERLKSALSMFDAVRIDHFRGFAEYWAVPSESTTAKSGAWEKGPGMDFFRAVEERFGKAPIIAEDLGEIDDTVRELLKDTGFPGMKIMQFGFLSHGDDANLPHNYPQNSVAYTGTHDNTTTLGWLWEAEEWQRELALDYCSFRGGDWGLGGYQSPAVHAFLRTLWRSSSSVAIIPAQDLCGYGGDTKMNTPGKAEDNWTFRFMPGALDAIDYGYLGHITRLYRRNHAFGLTNLMVPI